MPNLDLVLFSAEKKQPAIPRYAEFHKRPPQHKLKEIYGSCDVWVCPSWAEGYYLPAGEAIACGCALVSTKVGCVGEILEHEHSALISEPQDPEALAANLIRALQDQELRRMLVRNGQEKFARLNWEQQVKKMENILVGKIRSTR